MINLDRMKQYIDLGFTKEEALDLVKEEEEKEDLKNKEADDLKSKLDNLEKKISEEPKVKEEDTKKEKSIEIPNEDKTMTVEEAFKNIFK